jgi:hypothetical protein
MPARPRKRASNATIERGLLKVLDRSHTHVRRHLQSTERYEPPARMDTHRTETIDSPNADSWMRELDAQVLPLQRIQNDVEELYDLNDFGAPP